MAGPREALVQAVAARLAAEGIESATATYLANAVACRAEFDELGVAIDLGTLVAGVKADNVDLIGSPESATDKAEIGNPWKPGVYFNITKQIALTAVDPQLAERLRGEAGA